MFNCDRDRFLYSFSLGWPDPALYSYLLKIQSPDQRKMSKLMLYSKIREFRHHDQTLRDFSSFSKTKIIKRFNGIFTLFGKRERSQVSFVLENISTFPPEVGMCSLH